MYGLHAGSTVFVQPKEDRNMANREGALVVGAKQESEMTAFSLSIRFAKVIRAVQVRRKRAWYRP